MIHEDRSQFTDVINVTANRMGFRASLMEKDYYLTLALSKIHELSDDLVFKGGTCLNKIHYAYYRLSEDLDFSMRLPDHAVSRSVRRKAIEPVKKRIKAFARQFGMRLDGEENAGRNESTQYVYYLVYDPVMLPVEQKIKIEIGLRFSPVLKPELRAVQHKFLHPFTQEPLFDAGKVNCFALNEVVSEKLRAAALRKTIAPRDFYDLDFILRNKFDMAAPGLMELFAKKIEEDGGDPDLKKYRENMGRSAVEIKDMKKRIEVELFDVLAAKERKNFDLDQALDRINKAMQVF